MSAIIIFNPAPCPFSGTHVLFHMRSMTVTRGSLKKKEKKREEGILTPH